MNLENVLIVEDEPDWADIYERAIRKEGLSRVFSATSLSEAEVLVNSYTFALAIVDIGLDVDDDRNIDGLKVMRRIRDQADETSIVVVTGRTGQDVIKIVNEALVELRAFRVISKVPLDPDKMRGAVSAALEAFRGIPQQQLKLEVLHGAEDPLAWEWRLMKVLDISAEPLLTSLRKLLKEYLPLRAVAGSQGLTIDDAEREAYGRFWSRALGGPVELYLGNRATPSDTATESLRIGDMDELERVGFAHGFGCLLAPRARHRQT